MELSGKLSEIIFYNKDNYYMVGEVRDKDGDEITVVGNMIMPRLGCEYQLMGKMVIHPTYGEQFSFESYEEAAPGDAEAIEAFLASGSVKGIGKKMAARIVEAFGEETFEVIEKTPERLLEVSGIGEKGLARITESFSDMIELRQLVMFLQKHGISVSLAAKIHRQYGADSIAKIEENPYRLVDDVWGIGFKMADAIAEKLGIERDSDFRIESGLKYILTRETGSGHTFLATEELIEEAGLVLNIDSVRIGEVLENLPFKGQVRIENLNGRNCVFLMGLYLAETHVCKNLVRLNGGKQKAVMADVEGLIAKTEASLSIKLEAEQKNAVKTACENGVCVITGGPGTGKTTIINTILRMFDEGGFNTAVAAPTGRAAKRITETSGYEAKTIHRLLEYSYDDDGRDFMSFSRNADNPLDEDVIVIDEASMIDISLMDALLRAVKADARLVLVGDADQLPPVGAGNVLRDIIDSEIITTVRLEKIFRQAEESLIVVNAHRINRGENPYYNEKEKDFFFLKKNGAEEIVDTIKQLCTRRLGTFVEDFDPVRRCQVLSPVKKGPLGTANLNAVLQEVLNPRLAGAPEKEFKNKVFRPGDKVMQVRNNYDMEWKNLKDMSDGKGVFNGDVGYIMNIDTEYNEVSVVFDEVRLAVYDALTIDELELAYAVTVHKSQGSEYPVVIMPMMWIPPIMATRNLFYTAVTRAKQLVVLVGNPAIMEMMVNNNTIAHRNSGLCDRLKVFLEYE